MTIPMARLAARLERREAGLAIGRGKGTRCSSFPNIYAENIHRWLPELLYLCR